MREIIHYYFVLVFVAAVAMRIFVKLFSTMQISYNCSSNLVHVANTLVELAIPYWKL